MSDAVTVALIAAVPSTLAALGAWRSAAAGRRATAEVGHAVNHQGDDAPTLVEQVTSIAADVTVMKGDVCAVKNRLGALERRVGYPKES